MVKTKRIYFVSRNILNDSSSSGRRTLAFMRNQRQVVVHVMKLLI